MTLRNAIAVLFLMTLAVACGQSNEPAADAATENPAADAVADDTVTEAGGLQIKILKNGHGRAAEAGDFVTVHYTGWLYDDSAENNRGEKFDSSVDRGDRFRFELGAQRVIKGWDEGVAGMLIGEKRELTIPPEMGYGARGAGDAIPPDATLVFEVELFAAEPMGGGN